MAAMSYVRFAKRPPALLLAAAACCVPACVTKEERLARGPAPQLHQVIPDKVLAGRPFQVQPGNRSALSVVGENLVRGSRLRLNGQPLETSYGDGRSLSAIVPDELFAKPGLLPVSVETPDGQVSNVLPFAILAATGPAPEITQLFPEEARVGKPFNEQPGGKSALGVVGRHFVPGSVILINGEATDTAFGDVDKLSALVPAKFLTQPGTLRIQIRNPDGKMSPWQVLRLKP